MSAAGGDTKRRIWLWTWRNTCFSTSLIAAWPKPAKVEMIRRPTRMLCVCQSPERMILTKANCSKRKEGETGNWGMEKKSEPSKFVPMRDEHHNPGDHLETEASQCMHSHLYTFASHRDKQHVQRAEESRLHANLCDFFFMKDARRKFPSSNAFGHLYGRSAQSGFRWGAPGLAQVSMHLDKADRAKIRDGQSRGRRPDRSSVATFRFHSTSCSFDFSHRDTNALAMCRTASMQQSKLCWRRSWRPCSFQPGSGRKHSKATPSGPFLTRTFHSTSIQSGRKNFQFRQLKAISRCAVRDSVQQPVQCCWRGVIEWTVTTISCNFLSHRASLPLFVHLEKSHDSFFACKIYGGLRARV